MTDASRRFPAPWHAHPMPGGYVVRDANGQALAKRAFAKLPGPTPVTEIIAIRILELAHAGVFDPDKLTETVAAEFDM
jgi:hypothetical protein